MNDGLKRPERSPPWLWGSWIEQPGLLYFTNLIRNFNKSDQTIICKKSLWHATYPPQKVDTILSGGSFNRKKGAVCCLTENWTGIKFNFIANYVPPFIKEIMETDMSYFGCWSKNIYNSSNILQIILDQLNPWALHCTARINKGKAEKNFTMVCN